MRRLVSMAAVSVAALVACSSEPPLVEEFCLNGCNDFDPCTDDLCQSDGSCLNVASNPFGACLTDAHCDDGNPCSVDTCQLDGCGLMRCLNTVDDFNCVACGEGFTACDDFNPCTVETCGDDDKCRFDTTVDPNCDPQCNQTQAMSADVANSGTWFGYQNWYVGVATSRAVNCDGSACTCESELQLKDSLDGFELRDATGVNDPEWICDVVACEPRGTACRPLDTGVGYVVWGTMTYLNQFDARAPTPQDTMPSPDGGAAVDIGPSFPIDALLVEGYCLSTRIDHVVGDYAASFASNGKKATFDLHIEKRQADGLVVARMGACNGCVDTGLSEGQTATLGSEPGTVTFPFALGETTGFARLYAKKDRFVGDVRKADKSFLGVLELERIAP